MPALTRRTSLLLPLALWVLLAGIRMVAPSTLDDKDQPRVAFYTSDIVFRGQWVLQFSDGVDVATKPPLYQWTAAVISLAVGRLNDFTLLLPSLLASLAIVFIVWDWGREFGQRATAEGYWESVTGGNENQEKAAEEGDPGRDAQTTGYELACLSALVWVATYHVQRLQWTARTDMMVTAFGLGAIWASSRLQGARSAGSGNGRPALWRWSFWCLIALGALTKGQVAAGVALGAVAVEAALRKSWRPITDLWPWFGLPIAACVFALWFNAAWRAGGQAFWDTLVGNEFLARVAGTGERAENARPVWYFVLIFVGRFLPWSATLLLAAPLWWKEKLLLPRRRHPFLAPAAWTIGVFLIFSLPKGKRPDYILPAYAPASVLVAAVALAWLRRGWRAFGWKRITYARTQKAVREGETMGSAAGRPDSWRNRRRWLAGVTAVTVLGIVGYFFFGSEAARTHEADRTRRFGRAAYEVIQENPGPILYCDSSNSLVQFYLRTNQVDLSVEGTVEALQMGLEGDWRAMGEQVYVVTRNSREAKLMESARKALPGIEWETLLTGEENPNSTKSLMLLGVRLEDGER